MSLDQLFPMTPIQSWLFLAGVFYFVYKLIRKVL